MPSAYARSRARPVQAALPIFAVLLGALAANGCSQGNGQPSGGSGPAVPGSREPVEVVTAVPVVRSLGVEIESVGTALANEAVEITSKVSNTVTSIRFTEGERVRRGTVLVELDAAQTRAELAEAQAALAEARNQYARGQDLSTTQALSRAQLDQLETAVKTTEARLAAAQARLNDTVIRAPFDGRTGFRRVSVGSLVSAGSSITTLDDTSIIKLEFTVPQAFLYALRQDLPVEAMTSGLPGRSFTGRVATLGSRVDPVTRSIAVRAELPNPDGVLKPGMFMSVKLRGPEASALLVPEAALVPEQGRSFVFVVADGRAQRREVTPGRRRPGEVEIAAGLAAGERVIVAGSQKVRDGTPVTDLGAGGASSPAAAD
ncbi:MAG TPA: efflux RND transporter periplasmic adaptor subunit [Steroidobacteraceae bacterium]|nr:efflux RND transporter periplasmic adaptor subunit [Steroidobacteraceae bacterium]